MGRNSSDTSAILAARHLYRLGVLVDEIEIWSDTNGVYSSDPKRDPSSRHIPLMTHSELRELLEQCPQVLHSQALDALDGEHIPITIRNTFDPDGRFTTIVAD